MDRVLGWIFRQVEVTPRYHVERCLAAKGTGCTACADACPHDAIRIGRRVEIDPVDCTGCGICVRSCPSEALEPRGRAPASNELRCSQVAGDAPSVQCLSILSAPDLLRCAGSTGAVRLAHGDCATCPIGDADVPARVARIAEQAEALSQVAGRSFAASLEVRERLDIDPASGSLSRRELLRTAGSGTRRAAAGALAPLERLAGERESDQEDALPTAWIETLDYLALAPPSPETPVPVRLPRLEPGCILCPSCTRVCPTDALSRTFDEHGRATLTLEPSRCVGCDACMEICPVKVVRMDEGVAYGVLTGGPLVLAGSDPAEPEGSVAR